MNNYILYKKIQQNIFLHKWTFEQSKALQPSTSLFLQANLVGASWYVGWGQVFCHHGMIAHWNGNVDNAWKVVGEQWVEVSFSSIQHNCFTKSRCNAVWTSSHVTWTHLCSSDDSRRPVYLFYSWRLMKCIQDWSCREWATGLSAVEWQTGIVTLTVQILVHSI